MGREEGDATRALTKGLLRRMVPFETRDDNQP